ncbi:cystatin domain-containing protein [Streptomyces sp. NPDC001941]|uniref:cystatin domain-containing protein n=1 Tax=Streptomyces sp. NPDC001941 TaxID=3154659 RepID=UPI00332EA664
MKNHLALALAFGACALVPLASSAVPAAAASGGAPVPVCAGVGPVEPSPPLPGGLSAMDPAGTEAQRLLARYLGQYNAANGPDFRPTCVRAASTQVVAGTVFRFELDGTWDGADHAPAAPGRYTLKAFQRLDGAAEVTLERSAGS